MSAEGCDDHLDAVLDNGVCLICARIERDDPQPHLMQPTWPHWTRRQRPPRWLLAALWLYDRLRGRRDT